MNDNRYAPPSAPVADAAVPHPPADSELLHLATRMLWGSILLGIVSVALQWNYLTSLGPVGRLLFTWIFTFGVLSLLTYKIGQARNWARIVLLVLAVVGLPSLFLLPQVFARSVVVGSLSLIQSIAQYVALFILFATSARFAFRSK